MDCGNLIDHVHSLDDAAEDAVPAVAAAVIQLLIIRGVDEEL